MRRALVLAVCGIALCRATAVAAPAVRFAIVVGNNAPERAGATALRFADDDALATHRLLGEAGVHSVLLARLDDATARLDPGAHSDGLPRWADLHAAFDRLAAQMQRERAAGREVELLVFYSGHGDVARGEGYVLLEDRHLTRSALAALLARSPANRNHVIIDACKSYFMAFEKGPGGQRAPFAGGFVDPAASTGYLATTGFVLSTSSDRDSHEWDRFGGGVFSHEVRSALRGAADADRDGRISYAELGAFLATASQAIANPRLRPDFLVRPPAGLPANLADTVLGWDGPVASAVELDQPIGHIYVETAAGERVLDVHAAVSERVTLRVPAERPLFLRGDAGGGLDYAIRTAGPVRVSELAGAPFTVARRGAESVAFEQLFAVPFGRDSVRGFADHWTGEQAPAEAPIDDAGRPGATVQTAAGVTALASGALAIGATGWMIERYAAGGSASQAERVRINRSLDRAEIATAIAAPLAAASGALWLYLRVRSHTDDETRLTVLPVAGGAPGISAAIGGRW